MILENPAPSREKRVRAAAETPLYSQGTSHPSCPPNMSLPEGQDARQHKVLFLSWNIGGKPVADALKSIAISSPEASSEGVISLQELPRISPGWHTTKQEDGRLLVQYRDEDLQWRGNGIAFCPEHYTCLRRKASHLGVWLRLKHKATSSEFWASSFRLSTGVADDVTAQEMQDFLQLRPHQPSQAVLLGDFNTRLTWSAGAGRVGQVRPSNGRADYVVSEVESKQFQFCPPVPAQWMTPTSRPRRAGANGRQIDGAATRGLPRTELRIEEKSYMHIGGDHDRVYITVPFSRNPGAVEADQSTQPRMVTRNPQTQSVISQQTLEHLAKTHTRPYPGRRYRDPNHVKSMYRRAKVSGDEQLWKRGPQSPPLSPRPVACREGGPSGTRELEGLQGAQAI